MLTKVVDNVLGAETLVCGGSVVGDREVDVARAVHGQVADLDSIDQAGALFLKAGKSSLGLGLSVLSRDSGGNGDGGQESDGGSHCVWNYFWVSEG